MKTTRFLALAVALVPVAAMAGMGGESKRECTPGWNNSISRDDLRMLDYQRTPTVEALCQQLRERNWCAEDCETSQRLRTAFAEVKNEREKRAAAQQEEERRAALEKQAAATREADLRAGRVKPQNLGEVAIAYNAEIGVDLASAPKIRPDGRLYALPGKIAKDKGESPEFVAQLTLGEQNDALFRMTGRGGEINNRYFYVKIPKALRAYYFDQGKIGRGFDLVGRYVANMKYTTLAKEEKSAPVFEAVYFVMWQ